VTEWKRLYSSFFTRNSKLKSNKSPLTGFLPYPYTIIPSPVSLFEKEELREILSISKHFNNLINND